MEIIAIILVVISSIMHAVRDFLTKKANDKQIFVWWYEIFAMLFFLPLFLYIIFTEGIKTPIALYVGIAAGIVHFTYWIFLSKTYESGDLSHVYPIMRSSPAIVLIFSIVFLKEQLSFLGFLGIIIVAVGIYIINMRKITLSELFEPIRLMFKERAVQYAFLTLLAVSIYSMIDKVAVKYANPIVHIYFLTFFAFVFFTPYILHVKNKNLIGKEWKINKKNIIINGFFVITGYFLILVAFTIEKLSYIVGLRQLSVVIAVLLGGHLLKEEHKLIRFSAATLILIGSFMIAIAK